jgi:hypothetical protein
MRLYLHRDAADPESLALTSHGRGDLAGMMSARAQVLRLLVLAIRTIFVLKAAANREKPLSSAVSGAGAPASAAWRGSTDWPRPRRWRRSAQ